MRLTPDDHPLARWVTISLEGVDVTLGCSMADEEGGVIERLELENGVFHNDKRYTTHGAVKIELDPDAPESVKTLYLKARAAERAASGQLA